MDINKVNTVLRKVSNSNLNTEELFQLITVLNRQYIKQLVGETVIRLADNTTVISKG